MPRHMSFSKTIEAVRDRSKTVTRRRRWLHLQPGDELVAVEKGMGLKRGERAVRIARIRVVDVRREPLSAVTRLDLKREGLPHMSVAEFVEYFAAANDLSPGET